MYVRNRSSVVVLVACLPYLCMAGPGFRQKFKTMDNPYVTLYANENYKGAQHLVFLRGGCKNLPEDHDNWASSINTHNRCIDVCDGKDCGGHCVRLYPSPSNTSDRSLRLEVLGMNDKISSLKSCYVLVPKRT